MPPAQKKTNPVEFGIEVGDFVNVVINGSARHKAAEVLNFSDRGLTVRSNPAGLSLAEVTFVPWGAIEGVGLVGKR